LGAAVARAGLRARRDRRGGDRRHVALGWRGLDPRDGDRRVHHQHAHQRAAHPLGPAGVADRRHRRDRHPGGLSRHRPTAAAAVVNAVWDLWARIEGKPVWKLLVDMTPEQVVACIDFRYITDALTPDEALALLRRCASTKAERESEMRRDGFPAYTTSAGWLGYSDDKLRALCREAVNAGWTHLKMKVGRDIEEDVRRARIAREVLGPKRRLMFDANQVWDVGEAIANTKRLAEFDPYWIEEPTSPDDVLGHAAIARAIAPIRVATGE